MATSFKRNEWQTSCCSPPSGPGVPGPPLSRVFLGGFAATLAITMMMYLIAPMMGLNMDIAQMLGSMLGGSWWAGMLMHFMLGTVVFPLAYSFVLYHFLPGSPVVKGITFGAALWLVAQIVVMPMMGAGFFSSNAGGMMASIGSLMGHLLFGSVLGLLAQPADDLSTNQGQHDHGHADTQNSVASKDAERSPRLG
jgi:hypothetical protein